MKNEFAKIKEILKKNWIWIIFLISLIGFLAIAEDIFNNEIMKLDTVAYKIMVKSLRNIALTQVMVFITNIGGVITVIAIAIASLLLIKDKKIGIAISGNLALISILNLTLKNIVQRPRPEGYRLIAETGYSFPSGHSMISTAFYGFIIYVILTNIKNKKIKYVLSILLGILIPIIAISRVYLGVHYASDVTAGFLLSIAYLICYIKVYKSFRVENEQIKDKTENIIQK